MMGAPRLRLKLVLVQPVFLLDDGENLTDVQYGTDAHGSPIIDHPVLTILANEWAAYSTGRFLREVAEWQARINAAHSGDEDSKA
jgi:hypothetical protein